MESMKMVKSKRNFIITSALFAAAVGVFLLITSNAVFDSENLVHFAMHFIMAIVVLLLALVRFRRSPKPTRIGRLGRITLVTGLALFGVATLVEAIGAFGYLGDANANKLLTSFHDVSYFLALPGMFITMIGVALGLISLLQRKNSRII